jgi:hypothetical protein
MGFIRILAKAAILFVLFNGLFLISDPLTALGRLSGYNRIFPGRPRYPFGEAPERAYNFTLANLEAMVAAHEVSGPRPAGEYRVFLIGDSSVWGTLLRPEETLAGALNARQLTAPDGRRVRALNLGYPTLSLTKDLLLLERVRAFQPDLIIWLVTLESLPRSQQLESPLLQQNAPAVRDLIARYGLQLDPGDPRLEDTDAWSRTLIGQRRGLADLLRLQLYGPVWAATGIDQDYPDTFTPRQEDLAPETDYYGLARPLRAEDLAFDVLAAGHAIAGDVPILLINEPIFVSQGANSDLRYNFYYPRWAYDHYRQLLAAEAERQGWALVDLWDLVPGEAFTNSAIHYSAAGSQLVAERLEGILVEAE